MALSSKIRCYLIQGIFCFLAGFILIISIYCFIPSTLYASQWEIRTTTHFDLYYKKMDRLLADYIMETAEHDYKRIVEDIGIDPGIKADVYLAPDRKIYTALQPEGKKTHEWAIGVFYPDKNLILLLSPKAQKAGHPDLRETMAHELTHFILHTITREKNTKLPAWLHEGLAMYEARQWNWHYSRIMAQTSLSRSFIPLADLTDGFPEDKRFADRAYAQSISLIAFIINKHGLVNFHRIIKNMVEGMKTEDTIYKSLGIPLKDFERQWHSYLRRRYTWLPVLTSSFTIWFLITLMTLSIYLHKRRLARKRVALWDIEEQINSLHHL